MLWRTCPDQSADTAPASIPLFVYGTLAPGEPAWDRISGSVVGEPVAATTRGRLHRAAGGDWPVLVEGGGVVHGLVLPVAAGADLWNVLGGYELGWGYELRWVDVEAAGEGRGRALACVWTWSAGIGEQVPSGSWQARGAA